MTKDVLLSMKGMQFDITDESGNAEDVSVVTSAQYYNRGGKHFLLFDEVQEGTDDKLKNIIKFDDRLLEVTKRGTVNAHMVFDTGNKNLTDYNTPYGNILIGIETRKIRVDEQENRISVQVDYGLDVNYEHLSECSIHMDICPKDGAGLIMDD
jgi:uncharacterized beta-barrel protein YwiB (DUF1934 family)